MRTYKIYKTTNLVTGEIYIGHTSRDNPNYLGSGPALKESVRVYGRENFSREILFVFDNEEEARAKEAELVDRDFLLRRDTLNISPGGAPLSLIGRVNVKDVDGNVFQVSVFDERYLSGELLHVNTGMVAVQTKDNKTLQVCRNDHRLLSGELTHVHIGKTSVRDNQDNTFKVSVNDPRLLTGELVSLSVGTVTVKDSSGAMSKVSTTDPRYLSGELAHNAKGTTVVKDKDGLTQFVTLDDPRLLAGELMGINRNTKYIHNKANGERKMVDEVEMVTYLELGWEIGMGPSSIKGKKRIYCPKTLKTLMVFPDDLEEYLDKGWLLGRGLHLK